MRAGLSPMGAADIVRQAILEGARRGLAVADLRDDVPLGRGGLDLDSVAIVEIVLLCEERLGVALPADLLEPPPATVGDLIARLVARRP